MPKYKVNVEYTLSQEVYIDADTEEEVEDLVFELARENIENEVYDIECVYLEDYEEVSREEAFYDYYEEDIRQQN